MSQTPVKASHIDLRCYLFAVDHILLEYTSPYSRREMFVCMEDVCVLFISGCESFNLRFSVYLWLFVGSRPFLREFLRAGLTLAIVSFVSFSHVY